MKKNVGTLDKYIRIILGLVCVGVGVRYQTSWLTVLGGLIFFSGWYRTCFIYTLFGIRTCPIESHTQSKSTDTPHMTDSQ